MKNQFKTSPLTIDEIVSWKLNPNVNPRTNKIIKENGNTYLAFTKAYIKNNI